MLLRKFVEEENQDFNVMESEEQAELLTIFAGAPGDFKNFILEHYGKLPVDCPADWGYRSTFGDEWKEKIKGRKVISLLERVPDEDLSAFRKQLGGEDLQKKGNSLSHASQRCHRFY
ncbi:MAG: pyruvate carboxylase [Thermoanaerobacterium sp.]|nr:pyruvate carboxylase [Thermoanaerobacterium sp.]